MEKASTALRGRTGTFKAPIGVLKEIQDLDKLKVVPKPNQMLDKRMSKYFKD